MDVLTRQYRAQNLTLRAQTIRDLQKLWPALSYADLAGTYDAWFAGASAVVVRDASRAAGLASAYLRATRFDAGITAPVAVRLAAVEPDRLATSLRVTTLVAIKRSTLAGKSPTLAMADAFVQSSGAATRLALDAGRDTIRRTSIADPRTVGWERVTSGGCDFCRLLAGRGEVYREETVKFDAHDHCACSARPVYR